MAKLNRERRLLERRLEKQARKDARKREAANPSEAPIEVSEAPIEVSEAPIDTPDGHDLPIDTP